MEFHRHLIFGYYGLISQGGGVMWNWDVGDQKEENGAAGEPQRGRSEHGQGGGRGRVGEREIGIRTGCGATAGADDAEPAGGDELQPAVGEIDGDGGEGGASAEPSRGKPDP